MMKVVSCMILVHATLEVGIGAARAMEGCRYQEAGTEELNLGALLSGKQRHSGEGTQNTPSPVEIRAWL